MTISNDLEFKNILARLNLAQQRQLGARFVENVLALCMDPKVKSALDIAARANAGADELEAALAAAKKASVDSFTQCGKECDWHTQSGHFVAEAALACLKPASSPAWEAAMHARMARTCETIALGKGTDNLEAAAQYRLLAEFMNDQGN